jgi:hypothetical protein
MQKSWALLAAVLLLGSGGLYRWCQSGGTAGGPASAGPAALASSAMPALPTAGRARILQDYGHLPLFFEHNEGQTDRQVQYLSRGAGYALFLTPGEAVFNLTHTEAGKATVSAVLRARLDHANLQAPVAAAEPLPGSSNYLVGNTAARWHTGLRHYSRVRYSDIYPGIDLVYYGTQQQLEYDFVVAPGADPQHIRLSYAGADALELNNSGDLVISTAAGRLLQRKPVVYQNVDGNRRLVAGSFVLDTGSHRVGFALGDYDRNRALVIDPTIVYSYSTYFGGGVSDSINAIAVDSSGSAYVAGATASLDFPVYNPLQFANARPASSTLTNGFVSKFSADGQSLVYSTYLGGSGGDWVGHPAYKGDSIAGIAVDGAGSAYVTGTTSSADFPTINAFQAAPASAITGFVSKLSADGQQLDYSTYFGGALAAVDVGTMNHDIPYGIAVDAAGSAYVGGGARSASFPLQSPFQATPGGAFLSKFSADGQSLVYSTYLGSPAHQTLVNGKWIFSAADVIRAVALDSSGSAYVTGATYSRSFPLANAFQTSLLAQYLDDQAPNAFLTKFSTDGQSLVYSTYLGGQGGYDPGGTPENPGLYGDFGIAIAVDASGSAYVGGSTHSKDFPTAHAYISSSVTFNVGFITRFSADGQTLIYSTYTPSRQIPKALAVDAGGKLFAADIFYVYALSADGQSQLYSFQMPGNFALFAHGLAVDADDNVYIGGQIGGGGQNTTSAFQTSNTTSSGNTGFLAKINSSNIGDTPPTVSLSISPDTVTQGQSTNLSWTSTGASSCLSAWDNATVATSGSQNPSTATIGSKTYFLYCSGAGGTTVSSALLTVGYGSGPATVTIGLSPASVFAGGTSILTWSSTNATSCTASGAWSGGKAASGSTTVTGAAVGTQTYNLSCTGANGSGSNSATLTVTPPAPAVTISVAPATVGAGSSATLSWSVANSTSCTASGAWSGSKASSGSTSVTGATAGVTQTYTLNCTGSGGSASNSAVLMVTSPAPVVTMGLSPASVSVNGTSTLTWSSTNATSCTASGAWSGTKTTSGITTVTGAAIGTQVYHLSCTGSGGSGSNSATLTVTAAAPTVVIGLSPASVSVSGTSTLIWSSTNATSCTASGAWSGTKAASGSATVTGAAAGTQTYSLSCTGAGGSGSSAATLTVTSGSGGSGSGGSGSGSGGGSSGSSGGAAGLDMLGGLLGMLLLRTRQRSRVAVR